MTGNPNPIPAKPSEESFRVRPARREDLPWISELQREMYSAADAVPLALQKEWFEANPNGFFIVENGKGRPAGHMTLLPVKKECLDRYKEEGEAGLIEREIRNSCLHRPQEMASASDLYLESLILPLAGRTAARQALMAALPGMIARLGKDAVDGNILAMAATLAGEKWLLRMGFLKISRAGYRRDRHNLYQASLPDFLRRAAAR